MNIPMSPIAICTISSWCEWYMNVPGRVRVNSYRNVSPASIARCESPPTPSIPLGTGSPCQWTLVGSGSLFVT